MMDLLSRVYTLNWVSTIRGEVQMRVPPERRAELYAEGLKRIALAKENDYRRFLLAECLEAYANLDDDAKQQVQALLTTEPYQHVGPIMMTTYERRMLAALRRITLRQLEAKFGALSPEVKQRVETLTPEELEQLTLDLLKAESL